MRKLLVFLAFAGITAAQQVYFDPIQGKLTMTPRTFTGNVTIGATVLGMGGEITSPLGQNTSELMSRSFGVVYHWSPASFLDTELPNGDLSPDTAWAPTGLNIDQWLDSAVAAGAKWAALTTKHHDGFALWPTAWAHPLATDPAKRVPYSIAQTAWYAANKNPDIVRMFVAKCRAKGLLPVIYFSIWDKTHELRTGTTAATNSAAYVALVKAQLTELLSNYGPIPAIWTDGWGWQSTTGYTNVPYASIYAHIKSLQPNCLLLENNNNLRTDLTNTDLIYWERGFPGVASTWTLPLVAGMTIRTDGTHWFYYTGAGTLLTSSQIHNSVFRARLLGATYVLDLTPDRSGSIPSDQIAVMDNTNASSWGTFPTQGLSLVWDMATNVVDGRAEDFWNQWRGAITGHAPTQDAYGWVFDGSSQYLANAEYPGASRSFSAMVCFKDNSTSEAYGALISKSDTATHNGWDIGYNGNSKNFGLSHPFWAGIFGTSPVGNTDWACGAVTVGAGATATVNVYVNGNATPYATGTTTEAFPISSSQLIVGASNNGAGSHFKGGIAFVAIWSRELAASEIVATYRYVKPLLKPRGITLP